MPKTKEQNEAIKLERRNAILKGALFLFALRGYDSTSSDSISKFIGCSHGLLYHYFPSKEALFTELFNEVIQKKHRLLIENIDLNENPKFLLKDLLDTFLNALRSPDDEAACVMYLLLNIHLQKQYIPKPKSINDNLTYLALFTNVIERGKEEKVFYNNNTKELVVSILAMLKGLSFTRINLSYKHFKCPTSDIIARMIIKE